MRVRADGRVRSIVRRRCCPFKCSRLGVIQVKGYLQNFERIIDENTSSSLIDCRYTFAHRREQFYPDGLSTPTLCVCGHTTDG
ncbi:unnamed protein product, partial [Iphiclides podalirius]